MTILVSRTWPADAGTRQPSFAGRHPHFEGRGSGGAYSYPDEMWAKAQAEYLSLQDMGANVAPGVLVRYEWVPGYPDGYALLEGAICSLSDKPEDFLPATVAIPRKWIVFEPALGQDVAVNTPDGFVQ